jgi:hypothetical protein
MFIFCFVLALWGVLEVAMLWHCVTSVHLQLLQIIIQALLPQPSEWSGLCAKQIGQFWSIQHLQLIILAWVPKTRHLDLHSSPKEGQSQRSQRTMKNFHSCLTSDCLTTALIVAVAWSHATFLSMGLSWRHLTISRAMQRREGWQKCASWCCASSASVPGQWWQFDNSW